MQLINDCFEKTKKDYLNFLIKEKIYKKSKKTHIKSFKNIYIPIAFWINNKYKKKGKPLFLGLSASQGSGKTTVAAILSIILKIFFKRNVCVISIDDFYKKLSERKKMSKQIHELFLTRGVPGTHDTNLLYRILKKLLKKNFKPLKIPRFDKSIDDRLPKNKWVKISKKPSVIIFEGWCVGAKHQSNKKLTKPINKLEKNSDKKLTWRKKVNNELIKNYKKIFNLIDKLIYLEIPSFKYVFKWRLLQEKKLKLSAKGKKVMTFLQIKNFIMFYERITKQMIKDLKFKADITIKLDKKHRLSNIRIN